MINVPERVKDALRSGEYRKNYRITTDPIKADEYTYNDYDDFTSHYSSAENEWFIAPFMVHINQYNHYPYFRMIFNTVNRIELWWGGNYISIYDYPEMFEVTAQQTIITIKDEFEHDEGTYLEVHSKDQITSIYVYSFDYSTIDNNNLIAESIKFDERMCSDTELKFGLCEGTSVEFQYFDFPSLLNRSINIVMDVQYKDADGKLKWCEIPMGHFDVVEISRQASTGIFKATAYNKLMSKYMDAKVNASLIALLDAAPSNSLPLYSLLKTLLGGYSVDKPTGEQDIVNHGSYIDRNRIDVHMWGIAQAVGTSSSSARNYNGYRYGLGEAVIPISVSSQYNSAYFYKFIIDTYSDICISIYREYLRNYTSNIFLWCDEEQKGMSVEDYVTGNYEYSKYFGGYYELVKTNETVEYPLNKSRQIYNTGFISGVEELYIHIPTYIYEILLDEPARSQDINHNYPSCVQMDSYVVGNLSPYGGSFYDIIPFGNSMAAQYTRNNAVLVYLQTSESAADQIVITESQIAEISEDITLRDLQSAVYEVNCQYGKLDRSTDLFSGIELNNGGLYPRDNLYPADNLYPQCNAEAGYPSMYSKLWADEKNVRSFRYLIITYKTTETIEGQTQEVEKTLQRTVNANGTDDYNMSDNWLFRNLIWTAQQVGAYADAMVTKMQNIRWFPFEMWCAGLPYLEAGDEIEITMNEGTYKSYVLRRTLNGIQNLQDEMINGTLDIF